jgi:hypothetical protein
LRVAATCLRTGDPRLYDVNLSVACGCPAVAGILDPRDQSHLSIFSGSTQGFSPSLQLTLLFHSANRVCTSDSQCCLVAEKQSTLFVTPTPAYPSFHRGLGGTDPFWVKDGASPGETLDGIGSSCVHCPIVLYGSERPEESTSDTERLTSHWRPR